MFRKAITALGSVALIGATVGTAAAAHPTGFTSDTAVVTGVNAAAFDGTIAAKIAKALTSESAGDSVVTMTGGAGVTEDEVVFGTLIDTAAYKIDSVITDSKVPSLLDEKFAWDDSQGSDDYDIHEELIIGDMYVYTSFNDEDLEGVALTNEAGFEYRYVFDDQLNITGVGNDNADDLYLTILGEEYEIEAATATSVTVVTSKEYSLGVGESVTVDGETFTVDSVYSDKAIINGKIISESNTKKIQGMRVKVESVGYHSNSPEASQVILKIGEDISKSYSSGEEYIGEDDEDPLWVWNIAGVGNTTGGFIGVKYNANINDADDNDAGDSIKYVGEGYVMPNGFAEVKLEGTTDVDYEDVTVKFSDVDLYNSSNNGVANEDKKVIVITAETTSTIHVGEVETMEMYIYYSNNASATEGAADADGAVEVFYKDHDNDNTPTNKARFEKLVNLSAEGTLARTELATIEIGDTSVGIDMTIASGNPKLTFENPNGDDINLTIEGDTIADEGGTFEKFGATAEDADALDVVIRGTDMSTKEKSIMDYYGIIVARDDSKGVEGNADDDEVVLSIPDDQVYAQVSVLAGGEVSGTSTGIMVYDDTESEKFDDMNLVVVGGSAINTVAADLLGSAYSGAAFTEATKVKAGEFLIESFAHDGNTALLVAGYNAADTTKAGEYLMNSEVKTEVGTKYIGTSRDRKSVV